MGFIYGIINLDGSTITEDEMAPLAAAVGYEGFVSQTIIENNVALGFCHYPGRMPKAGFYIDDNLMVVADIRMYNQEFLNEARAGVTQVDIFAKAFLFFGLSFANQINGDFAAVVIDRKKNEVHLLRDHIGARPLVYCLSGNRLLFASHEFGLAKSGVLKPELSEKKLIDTFLKIRGQYEQTVFRQIFKVVPGNVISFSADGQRRVVPYWKPENIKEVKGMTFSFAAEHLRELIVAATQNRMEKGKTGMHISGGIDSCSIAAIVAQNSPDKSLLTGYSWTPEVSDGLIEGPNEKELINSFCKEAGVRLKYLNTAEGESAENVIIPEFEHQTIELPVMIEAGKDGVEIIFSGWGGDEFVSLSMRGVVNHLFFSNKWKTLLKFVRKIGFRTTIAKFRIEVIPQLVPFGLMPVYKAERPDWSVLRLFKHAFIWKHRRQIFIHHRKNIFGHGNRKKFTLNLIEYRHLQERIDSWAINAEKYGLEYKYPLLDKEVLEFWFTIPVEHTYRDFQSRLLFREAMKGILTDKIRLRSDKREPLRTAFSQRERRNNRKFLANVFNSMPQEEHLSFVRADAFKKAINKPPSKNEFKNNRALRKLIIYLRCVALVRKYITGQEPG